MQLINRKLFSSNSVWKTIEAIKNVIAALYTALEFSKLPSGRTSAKLIEALEIDKF